MGIFLRIAFASKRQMTSQAKTTTRRVPPKNQMLKAAGGTFPHKKLCNKTRLKVFLLNIIPLLWTYSGHKYSVPSSQVGHVLVFPWKRERKCPLLYQFLTQWIVFGLYMHLSMICPTPTPHLGSTWGNVVDRLGEVTFSCSRPRPLYSCYL